MPAIAVESYAGFRYGKLTVVRFSHRQGKRRYFVCSCDCGSETIKCLEDIRRLSTSSCGCSTKEHMARVGKSWSGKPKQDLSGEIHGRLTVLGLSHMEEKSGGGRRAVWECLCECGRKTTAVAFHLRGGKKKSCGCLRGDSLARHGHARVGKKTRTYSIWRSMITRCEWPQAINYQHYGGRGIKVCDRWKQFENFLEDVGEIPSPLSIDRIDCNGDYCPENCRLATPKEQASNKRK